MTERRFTDLVIQDFITPIRENDRRHTRRKIRRDQRGKPIPPGDLLDLLNENPGVVIVFFPGPCDTAAKDGITMSAETVPAS